MKVIIDRFEGDVAIVEIEEGKLTTLKKELIPYAKEGDVIEIIINHQETEKRKKHISNLMSKAFESENIQ
jgi:diphthamide synthase subunit DPH2